MNERVRPAPPESSFRRRPETKFVEQSGTHANLDSRLRGNDGMKGAWQ